MSGQKERVFAEDGQTLRFYCCGPTVYGPAHIGNFRTFVLQDVFRRVAETLGQTTRHIRNVTDVDDKTIRGAREAGQSLGEFTAHWQERFEADAKALNLLPPHDSPGAVDYIDEQVEMIASLVDKGLAYQAKDGSVYYRVDAFPNYGRLSGLQREAMVTNADGRLSDADEAVKETQADFVLWKAWKEEDGDNQWDSPWGPGRPGWHIECSAMSRKFLGDSFDLHSGGVDLIFPHHENEIAQSEGCTGCRMARHWFHIAHLQIDGGKMSKSLGNLYTLDDVKEKGFTAEELRYVLLSGHYRQPLSFTWKSLEDAGKALKRLRRLKARLGSLPEAGAVAGRFEPVLAALADDLNTSKALGQLFAVAGELEKDGTAVSEPDRAGFVAAMSAFGFLLEEPDAPAGDAPEEVRALAQRRWEAKQAKDWAAADTLRDEITAAGWRVKDAKDGFELKLL